MLNYPLNLSDNLASNLLGNKNDNEYLTPDAPVADFASGRFQKNCKTYELLSDRQLRRSVTRR